MMEQKERRSNKSYPINFVIDSFLKLLRIPGKIRNFFSNLVTFRRTIKDLSDTFKKPDSK